MTAVNVPLEDEVSDILAKAQRGLDIADLSIAEAAGISVSEYRQLRSATGSADSLEAVCPVLKLRFNTLNLMAAGKLYPERIEVAGLHPLTVPVAGHAGMTVNCYIISDLRRNAVLFDCGVDAQPVRDCLDAFGLALRAIFITHGHFDHVQCLPDLQQRLAVPVYAAQVEGLREAEAIAEGAVFQFGDLKITALETPGHTSGGTSYLVEGLELPIALTGDALFCLSVGGIRQQYLHSLELLRSKILSLPDATVICPGHGPLSTVGFEQRWNPFF